MSEALFKRIDHIALECSDLERSIEFYEATFGFQKYFEHPTPKGMRIAYLKLGDTVLELMDRDPGQMKGYHFCLETTDFEGAVSMLKAQGVPVVMDVHHTPAREPREEGWRRVVFEGPDGEHIELRGS